MHVLCDVTESLTTVYVVRKQSGHVMCTMDQAGWRWTESGSLWDVVLLLSESSPPHPHQQHPLLFIAALGSRSRPPPLLPSLPHPLNLESRRKTPSLGRWCHHRHGVCRLHGGPRGGLALVPGWRCVDRMLVRWLTCVASTGPCKSRRCHRTTRRVRRSL